MRSTPAEAPSSSSDPPPFITVRIASHWRSTCKQTLGNVIRAIDIKYGKSWIIGIPPPIRIIHGCLTVVYRNPSLWRAYVNIDGIRRMERVNYEKYRLWRFSREVICSDLRRATRLS
jgi:hypothetical protein